VFEDINLTLFVAKQRKQKPRSDMEHLMMTVSLLLFFAAAQGFTTTARSGIYWRSRYARHGHDRCRTTDNTLGSSRQSLSLLSAVDSLKSELFQMGLQTNRGFEATSSDRERVDQLIKELTRLNPTREPARAYYSDLKPQQQSDQVVSANEPSAAGKWTLIYTDAPDITSLQTNPLAVLGRIGQNCDPPFIENVIEWKRPAWVPGILGGPDRILQKVVTKGVATEAATVDLTVSGIRFEPSSNGGESSSSPSWLPPPLDISRGLFTLPFGRFQILYLDNELRIVRTGQNYLSVNQRLGVSEEWF
jgi:PAP_fibrillin